MCLSSSFIMSSSLAQLSAAFSVLLAAITHFTLAFFQRNKHSQRVTFAGQFLVCLGKFPLGSKLISGGVAIRMSWCAFFEKINSRGDVYSGLESKELYQLSLIQKCSHLLFEYSQLACSIAAWMLFSHVSIVNMLAFCIILNQLQIHSDG